MDEGSSSRVAINEFMKMNGGRANWNQRKKLPINCNSKLLEKIDGEIFREKSLYQKRLEEASAAEAKQEIIHKMEEIRVAVIRQIWFLKP
jgi:hypothetical protein